MTGSEPVRPMKSIVQRFLSGAGWTLLGNMSWRGLSMVSTIVVANLLGPKLFGGFNLVRTTIDVFAVYAGFRMGDTSSRYVARYRHEQPNRASAVLNLTMLISLIFCFFMSSVVLLFSSIIATESLNNPGLRSTVAIAAFFLFFMVYGGVVESSLSGFENYQAIAKANVYKGVLTLGLVVPFTLFWGMDGTMAALALTSAIVLIPLLYSLKVEINKQRWPKGLNFQQIKKELPVIWHFALPGVLTGILLSGAEWGGRALLARQGNGFFELGLFSAANQWRTIILFLPAVLVRVALPILSSSHGIKDKFDTSIDIQLKLVNGITLPLTIFIMGFSVPLSCFFGKSYYGMEKILPFLMLSVYFFSLNQSLRVVFDGAAKRWITFSLYIFWVIVFFICCFLLIPEYLGIGLSLAYLISHSLVFIIQSFFLHVFMSKGFMKSFAFDLFYSLLVLLVGAYVAISIDGSMVYLWTLVLFSISFNPLRRFYRLYR